MGTYVPGKRTVEIRGRILPLAEIPKVTLGPSARGIVERHTNLKLTTGRVYSLGPAARAKLERYIRRLPPRFRLVAKADTKE